MPAYLWPRLLREAGIVDEAGAKKYTFHALRHFFVSMLIEHGLQPFHTSKMVGHSKVSMTLDTYGHLFPSDTSSKLAIEAVASQFFSTAPSVAPVPLITTRAIPVSEALEPDRERMRQLHAEGKSIREISEIMGYPTSTIGYWINPRVRVMALANAEQQRQKRRDAAQRSRDAAKSPDAAQVQHEPVKTLS